MCPVDATVPGEQTIRVNERMGRDEEVGQDAPASSARVTV